MIKKLPSRVVLLGWVSLLADISSEMIYPLIPLFLTVILGAPAIALGLIEGGSQLIVSVMTAYSGIKSDRTGKRVPFVRWGYGLPVLGKALLSIAYSWHFVFLGKTVDRFGKGLRGSPRDALIADAATAEGRGAAFGFHRTMDTAGAVIGVFLAALLMSFLVNDASSYRLAFALSSIFALLSLSITFFVKESESISDFKKTTNNSSLINSVSSLGRRYWTTLSVLMLFAFANSSDAFLLLRAADVGLTPVKVILAYALYNFGYSALSYFGGKISDKVGRWKVILVGWILYAVVYAGFAVTTSTEVWALFALYGLYMALTEGVSKALIIDCVSSEHRGTALGVLYSSLGMAAISSNILAGYLWDSVSKAAPFYVGAAFAVIAIFGVIVSGLTKEEKTI